MLRAGLCIYLVLGTLAGPLLCPCSAPFLRASTASTDAVASHPVARSCPCRPKPVTTSGERSGTCTAPTHKHPDPGQNPCPCPTHGHHVVAYVPQRLQTPGEASGGVHDGAPLDAPFSWAELSLATSGRAVALRFTGRAFTDPKEFLHVFHILRC